MAHLSVGYAPPPWDVGKPLEWISRELKRHLENLQWALREALKHLEQGEVRQAYNKVFLAWREAIAYVVTLLLADPSLRSRVLEALRKLPAPPIDVDRVTVTTSNAPKTLKTLIALCRRLGCRDDIVKLLELLEEARPIAYMLHTAFYEGVEHASFTDEEAKNKARELLRKLATLLSSITG